MVKRKQNMTTLIMYYVAGHYCLGNDTSGEDFFELNKKYGILDYIAASSETFENLKGEEILKVVDEYILNAKGKEAGA